MPYKVTDTREITQMTQAGTSRKTYRVWLVTDRGASGSLDVPADKWNADDLPALLDAKAFDLDLAFDVTG